MPFWSIAVLIGGIAAQPQVLPINWRTNMKSDKQAKARIAQAEAEDAADAAWLAECQKIQSRVGSEHPGLAWYEVAGIACKEFPPQPAGFRERRTQCNRCGQKLELHPDYDAQFCRRCNRWIESRCLDPQCEFCSHRPERPLP